MNHCKDCVRKANQCAPTECPNCKKQTLTADCRGPSMVLHCNSCGWEIVGASFWAPCEEDSEQYTVTISRVDKGAYVQLAEWAGANVVQLYNDLASAECYSKRCSIEQILKLTQLAEKNDIEFAISPDPFEKYPELMDCPLRIAIKRA